ncbi:MAG TPA: hypothetical protein VF659_14015 [Pyrinomonadaceae bacterium]|jgi:hypothetical protein
MSIIVASSSSALGNEQLRQTAQIVFKVAELSAQKAALHFADPQGFPHQGPADSFENIFLSVFRGLPAARQQAVKLRAAGAAAVPPAQRAASLGPLGGLDFRSPVPLAEQAQAAGAGLRAGIAAARRLPGEDGDFPLRGDDPRWPIGDGPGSGGGHQGGGGTLPLKRVVLRLHSIKCVKETKEWGKDEIDLAGSAVVVTTGATGPVVSPEIVADPFGVGSFHTGDTRSLGDRVLFAFNLPAPEELPVAYINNIFVIEKDWFDLRSLRGKIRDLAKKLAQEIVNWSQQQKRDWIKVVGALVAIGLNWLIDRIAGWIGHDYFDPVTVSFSIDSLADRLEGGTPFTPRSVVSARRGSAQYDLVWSGHIFS